MAKRPSSARKTLSSDNLAALGADRLAGLLIAATVGDTNLKRKLKLELAAEAGPTDLALEIDKRLAALAASRTRVSWRKRPELIADLEVHRLAIVDRLGASDAPQALPRLVAWFDLYPGLSDRVKDPKGELSALFFEASDDLAALASAVEQDAAAPVLADAVETRLSDWGGWIGRAAPAMSVPLSTRLLALLSEGRAKPTGRRALVVRKLADRAADAVAWARTFPDEDRSRPEVGAEIARRLAAAGLAADARAALETARPRGAPPSRGFGSGRVIAAPEPSDAWNSAEIVVLEAEGRADEAQAARWAAFERTLDADPLRAFLSRLPDFDDVEAIDRAHAIAAGWADAARGLHFLMAWPALREAAAMIVERGDALRLSDDGTRSWVSRLETRYPNAALVLVRSRAMALVRLGPGQSEAVRDLSAEAAELAARPGALDGIGTHAAFIDALEAASPTSGRRGWR